MECSIHDFNLFPSVDFSKTEKTTDLSKTSCSKWEVAVRGYIFNFVRFVKISDSCHQLKTSITMWKVKAGFQNHSDYQVKYKQLNDIE